ncbi:MAG TPA: transposase, partial [Nitrososphaera sp.]
MIRSYKFRLYPAKQQVKVLNDTIETCRHLYNDSLGERNADWDVGYWEQQNLLPLRKQENKYYKQVHSQVLQDVLQRLDKSYQAFFRKIARYPKFKRREKYNSFTYPQYGGFKFKDGKLLLSHVGSIKIRMHRISVGTLKRCTVIREIDQWFCCITTDDGIENNATGRADTNKPVGIDVGLLNWLTLSDGRVITNRLDFEDHAKKIKRLQRNLARKKKRSNNREKARIQLAKTWRKVRHRRDDFVHKVSKILADEYTFIVF